MRRASSITTAGKLRRAIAKAQTINRVLALVAAAETLTGAAVMAKDVEAYREALALKFLAERQGGIVLMALKTGGKLVPVKKLGIDNVCQHWRDLAKLSPEKLAVRLDWFLHRGLPGGPQRKALPGTTLIKMNISLWEIDSNGCLSRTITAVSEAPVLEDENCTV
jgi:hypothetical protein